MARTFIFRQTKQLLGSHEGNGKGDRHQTKVLTNKTIAVHVRYNSLYISLPSSAKQQREMTKYCVLWQTQTTAANFSYFHLELNAGVMYLLQFH